MTVRKDGHVEPAAVETDLPKAVDEIKKGGSTCVMLSTTIENVHNEQDRNVIESAAKCNIPFYRTNWFKYPADKSQPEALEMYASNLKEMSELNRKLGIVGCYQNHAGTLVGASLWEVYKMLEKVDKDYFGVQYDIRHAMVEGANSWINGFELIRSQIKTIVLKDYKWGQVNGKWKVVNTPIGEGMVDFKNYFKLLKKYRINVPISLHCEYDLGGAEKGNRKISVILTSAICFFCGSFLFAQQRIPSDVVISPENLAQYLNDSVKNKLSKNGKITETVLTEYFRQKFAERFFYDWHSVPSRFQQYRQLYDNESGHLSRAKELMTDFSATTSWLLPFNHPNGEAVKPHPFQHLARQHKMVDVGFAYFYDQKNLLISVIH